MQFFKSYLFFFIVLVCFFLSSFSAYSQDIPPVSVYTADIYDADNQNWSVTQADNKTMFFANSKGLLKFDGERWELLGSLNNTIIRSVHANGNDIYTGAYMEFGVWKLNDQNQYVYHSLSEGLNLIEDEQFWNITTFNNYIIFQSLDAIYMYHIENKGFEIFPSETEYTKMVIKDNVLYFHQKDQGLFKLINGVQVHVNTTDLLKESILINLYNINNEIYAQTQHDGIINVNDNSLYKPYNFEKLFSEVSVYSSIQLENQDIYLGTISNGLIKISNDQIVQQLNQENGLSNNTILNLYIDTENNIWLSLDNGINCINIESNISTFNSPKGNLGTIYASIKFNDQLYLGTNQGLFIFDAKENNYELIKGTKGQVWSLFSLDNSLFCGHHNGTYVVEGRRAKLLKGMRGTWDFQVLDDNTIVTGNYEGLHLLKKSNSEWQHHRKVKGFDISTKYFELVDSLSILVNHEYKGIFKLRLNSDYTEVISVKKDTSVNKGLYSSIVKLKEKIFYAYEYGIFYYDNTNSRFVKDSILSRLYMPNNYSSGRLVKTEDEKIWIFSKTDISYVSMGTVKNEYIINKIPLSAELRNQISGYENVSLISPETYLIGKNDGYIKIKNPEQIKVKPQIQLNDISAFSLHDSDKPVIVGTSTDKAVFQHIYNNISFEVSSFNYNPLLTTEYQFKLIGYDDVWSDWDKNGEISYKNLPYGDYTFQSRSRIGQSEMSNTVSYQFKVERPFYLSSLMIVIYFLLLILLILVVHFIYKINYNRKKRELQIHTERKLEINELENQKEIMRIKNDKLNVEVENKNRELAISTMSLVKKNEFLSQIKSDLKPIQAKNKIVKKVLKTIDNNLNNTDDWKFFEEAFNNADKDFFKKLKTTYPELTPNELKLCAYLRLNLTSKEIAPLFNISPKSVEIKRYRLRKKMNLDRNISLTNYILSI